ncbi:MAG: GTPase HflX [Clostridia bacterium]|nr:GTPase HflX [Clostridia bacterium]
MGNIFTDSVVNKKQNVILVGIITRERDERECEICLDELERLADTAGGKCVCRLTQARENPDCKTYIGSGKLIELKQLCRKLSADAVIFDDELTPSQIRNLENELCGDEDSEGEELEVTVIDRTMLILDIFALHAQSGEGKIQVELAQLRYTIPRLSGKGGMLSRLGGGIGTRGPGESKLESDRRHLHRRITALEEQLRELEKNRNVKQGARERSGIKKVAIAGYTNAGKSTLLNLMTGAGVLSEDKLFATLDPTTRKYSLPCGLDILLTDTVGFIRNLPHHLIRAFRSTLDEVKFADIILVIVDASDPQCERQLEVTHKLLWDLGASEKRIIYVLNKCDIAGEISLSLSTCPDNAALISAKTGEGIDTLISLLEDAVTDGKTLEVFFIPQKDSRVLNELYKDAVVSDVEYTASGTIVRAIADNKTKGRLRQYIIGNGKDCYGEEE